jgi:GR25 family glycosyltransferase involved in LPS biosynthesis
MKNYVITIMDNDKSVDAADRCIYSGWAVGNLDIEKWKATTPEDDLYKIIKDEKINAVAMNEVYSRTLNCIAAFLSHYSLWKLSVESKEEVTIFEHDAVCTNNIPTIMNYNGVISLGAPSYGKFNTPRGFGVVPLTSKPYFPGAHAYRVKPAAAQMLIDQARMEARPTDVFLNINTFPFLQEFYPWPVEARDSFTTIQSERGCYAKHNFNDNYEIVDV